MDTTTRGRFPLLADMTEDSNQPKAGVLVEVARGRLKPMNSGRRLSCRAERIEAEKMALIKRWRALLQELGEAWIPQLLFVMQVGMAGAGKGELPKGTTVPEWEDEVAKLEAARDMRDKGMPSVN